MLFLFVGICIVIGTITGIIHRCTFSDIADHTSHFAFAVGGAIFAVVFIITLAMPHLYSEEEISFQKERIEYFEQSLEEKMNQLIEQENITYQDIKNDEEIQKICKLLKQETMNLESMEKRNTKIKQWEYIAWFGGEEIANENLSN